MTDIFDRVAMQALGSASTLRARVRSRFEPPLGRAAGPAESGPIWAEVDPLASGAATTPPSTPGVVKPPEATAPRTSGTEFDVAGDTHFDPTELSPGQTPAGPQGRAPSASAHAAPDSAIGAAAPPSAGAEPPSNGAPLSIRPAPSSPSLPAAEPRPGPVSGRERSSDVAAAFSAGPRPASPRSDGSWSDDDGPKNLEPNDLKPDGPRRFAVPEPTTPRDDENDPAEIAILRATTSGGHAPSERREGPGDPGRPLTSPLAGGDSRTEDRAIAPPAPAEPAEVNPRPRQFDDPLGVNARARIEGHLSEFARRPGPTSPSSPPSPIEVTIGRIEIRAGAAPPPRPATAFAPHLGLAAYRARRERGV